ncbi:hypothetical protein EVAR_85935_1 [Eumeta japonica]|uniref:Uncharacterized protein n=1 Tax=Eumeta variegata TaxID=151549 RepID=A0A4C2A318_EUMVA|nr:hypothetical protein EVAR_85935_1 [Eumeta japonica]
MKKHLQLRRLQPQHKKPQENPENEATTLRTTTTERMLRCAETAGKPGIRTRGVALFMDENTERLGIGFGSPWGKSSVSLSPGLANLINGSTSKTILKRKTFDSLEQLVIEGESCRMVRTRNKIVLLFTWTEDTPFIQASKVLHKLSESEQATPRVISIDSMSVGYEKGNVEDYLGSIAASENTRSWGHPVKDPEEMSGSERLRKQIQAEKETKHREAKELAREQRSETGKKLENFFRAFNAGIATKLKAFTSKKRVFDNRGQGKASTSKR